MSVGSSKVAVVVLCWNGREFLEEFLPSIVQFNSGSAQIIVADNASSDTSVDFVREHFPTINLIELGKNFGFAAGYNEAIARIDFEYIVLINQDVRVTENWLAPLLSIIERDPEVGAVQPRILSHLQPESFEYAGAAGGWIDQYGYTFCRGRIFDEIERDQNQYAHQEEIFWASGACMLLRKKVYEDLGGLDAGFFAHMEEIDLCWRMKNAGYRIIYCPGSKVYHLGGGSLPQGNPFKTYLNFRNNLLMMARNLPAKNYFGVIVTRMLLDQIAGLRSLITFQFRDFVAIWKAQFHFLRQLPKIKKQRGKIPPAFPDMPGVFKGSIVWQYFVKRKKIFSDIVK